MIVFYNLVAIGTSNMLLLFIIQLKNMPKIKMQAFFLKFNLKHR